MDLRQLVRYAVCFVSLVIPVSNAFGAVFVVDTTSDVIDGGDGMTSLREAVQAASTNAAVGDVAAGDAAGDIIRFDNTVFAPANNAVITLSNAPGFGDFLVSDDLEIDGVTGVVAVTLDGAGATRIFDITTTEAVLIDSVDLVNGEAGAAMDGSSDGGAVRVGASGDVTLQNLSISSSHAYSGGAVDANAGAQLTLSSVTLSGNSADRAGGGIESNSAVVMLTNCNVTGNSADINGGGFHETGAGNISIDGGLVSGNTAGQEGGGVWNSATGTMTLTGVTIDANTANVANATNDAQGGGGLFNNGGSVSVTDSSITNNVVSGANQGPDDGGGGIFNDGRNTPSAQVMLSGNTVVSGNQALSPSSNGGGVLSIGVLPTGDTLFSASAGVQILNNQADRAGGGVESNNADLMLTGVVISGNSTGVNGGGVHVTAGDVTTIDGGTVSGNTAGQEGGGVWNSATGTMTLTGVTIDGNTANVANATNDAQGGGGLFNNGGSVSVTDSSITNNVVSGANQGADDGGGGIFNDGRNAPSAQVMLSGNTVVSGNQALSPSSNGGGVLSIGVLPTGDTLFSASAGVQILNNQADRAGGGVESNNADLILTGVVISGNSTGVNGGGVHTTGGDVTTIDGGLVSGNTAGQEGGGVWNSATGTMTLTGVTIDGNTANVANAELDAQGGGGMFNNGGSVSVTDSSITNNVVSGPNQGADDGGGGIFNDGRNTPTAHIDLFNSTVSGNDAEASGGGIIVIEASLDAINATIASNSAATGGGIAVNAGTLSLGNVIVSGNTAGAGPDINGSVNSLGYNLVQSAAGAIIGGNTDGLLTGQSAQLGALADNGGPTLTHLPADTSPALDAGNGALAAANSITLDQRGLPRIVDTFVANAVDGIDMGSVEAQLAELPFTNASFAVDKTFDDGNPAEVEVTLSCNTGLPLVQSQGISMGEGVTFVVAAFDDGELNCSITESGGTEGYLVSYLASGDTASDIECRFEAVAVGSGQSCLVENTLQAVDIDVTKTWMDVNTEFEGPDLAQAEFSCSNEVMDEVEGNLVFEGNPDTETFSVFPDWDGTTTCTVSETDVDDAVEADDTACLELAVTPGNGASCAIVNTRFFEGIPTLDPRGLGILALLTLGIGLIGFRRYH